MMRRERIPKPSSPWPRKSHQRRSATWPRTVHDHRWRLGTHPSNVSRRRWFQPATSESRQRTYERV